MAASPSPPSQDEDVEGALAVCGGMDAHGVALHIALRDAMLPVLASLGKRVHEEAAGILARDPSPRGRAQAAAVCKPFFELFRCVQCVLLREQGLGITVVPR